MKNIKKFYKNNRIYCILMAISLLCLAVIVLLFVLYFVNQTKNDVYGNRLNGLESVKISKEDKSDLIDSVMENEMVSKTTINIKGKIIYVNVYLKEGNREDAEGIAIKLLNLVKDEHKEVYDINFSFVKEDDELFPYLGYKKNDATIITWAKASGE